MIAIVYPQFYSVAGIARYLDSFLANLPADHPGVILITGDEQRSQRAYPGVEIIHVPLRADRLSLFMWGLAVRKLLLRLRRDGRISSINFHWPPLIPGLFLPRGLPLVLTAHTTYLGMSGRFYDTRHFASQWGAASLAVKMWMERRVFARADKVVALTEQGRQEVLRYGYAGPVEVIPNGADVRKFMPDPARAKDIDVLFCGRIERRKGSGAMVELCRQLVARQPEVRICIVGYGDDDAWVAQQLAPLRANVTLTGKVAFEHMVDYYQRSHVYASGAYYEACPAPASRRWRCSCRPWCGTSCSTAAWWSTAKPACWPRRTTSRR
ncbi:glycosyltransferase family 4 protein [Rugamonas sp. DEMB1]|nr:glycosyltransferase family 4 protein [Rugamonas sp. DEMB1]WGG49140.1 glycosyltransferase family 4 protein [Rugamonas sp. DEMB1]